MNRRYILLETMVALFVIGGTILDMVSAITDSDELEDLSGEDYYRAVHKDNVALFIVSLKFPEYSMTALAEK